MTHSFHPWHGREFVFLSVRHNWSQDRVVFLDEDGVQHSLPVGWTDAVEADVFVTLAAGRCPFPVADLLVLAGLIDAMHGGSANRCKANFAACAGLIMPA